MNGETFPCALIEEKHERWKNQGQADKTFEAIAKLATNSKIPAFLVVYSNRFDWWDVTPLNEKAKLYYYSTTRLSLVEYGAFLYRLRFLTIPQNVIRKLEEYVSPHTVRIPEVIGQNIIYKIQLVKTQKMS